MFDNDDFPIEPMIHMARHRLNMGQDREEVMAALTEKFSMLGSADAFLIVVAAAIMEK